MATTLQSFIGSLIQLKFSFIRHCLKQQNKSSFCKRRLAHSKSLQQFSLTHEELTNGRQMLTKMTVMYFYAKWENARTMIRHHDPRTQKHPSRAGPWSHSTHIHKRIRKKQLSYELLIGIFHPKQQCSILTESYRRCKKKRHEDSKKLWKFEMLSLPEACSRAFASF